MSKRLILVLALAFVVGTTFAAYAGVQNVKVSGDIVASGVVRDHFNLHGGYLANDVVDILGVNGKKDLHQSFFMTQTRVRIDADLTDNVSATVRLINERTWGNSNYGNVYSNVDSYITGSGSTGTGVIGSTNNGTGIDLDLAYVTLKEFLYSPLTLTVGRQEIKFGNGLIIGKAINGYNILPIAQVPSDLSERKSFDAIRATLNYDPLVVDLMYSKILQPTTIKNNTIELWGINANYALNKKVDLSAYYFLKSNNNAGSISPLDSKGKADKVNTIGTLISARPINNLVTSLEAAYQFGKFDATAYPQEQTQHSAWAVQTMVDYTFAKMKMTPKIGGSYTYLSGGSNSSFSEADKNHYQGWDPMFYDQKLNNIAYAILPFTNLSVFNLRGSIKPVEDVTIALNYGYYDRAARATAGSNISSPGTADAGLSYVYLDTYNGEKHLGDAIDATITYDYTEDVQIGLTAGWFKSGEGITTNGDITGGGRADATQLIGSMKVTF